MRSSPTFLLATVLALIAATALAWSSAPDASATASPAQASSTSSDGQRLFLSEQQLTQDSPAGPLDQSIKSILNVRRPLRYGEFVWSDRGVPAGPIWVRVDLHSQLISVFRGG